MDTLITISVVTKRGGAGVGKVGIMAIATLYPAFMPCT